MACSQNSLSCLELGYVPSPENIAGINEARAGKRVRLKPVSWASLFSAEVPLLAVLAFVLAIAFLVRPDSSFRLDLLGFSYPSLVICPIFELTGVPCLFCGATRAFMAMGGFDVAGSFIYHPLGPAMFLLTVAAALFLAPSILLKRRFEFNISASLRNTIFGTIAILVLLAWPLKIYLWYRTGLL